MHLQLFAILRGAELKKGRFLLFRLLHGGLAAAICAVLLRLFPAGPAEALAAGYAGRVFSGTAAGGLSVLLLCLAFLAIASESREVST